MRGRGRSEIQRRAFLLAGGHTVALALAGATGGSSLLFAKEQSTSEDALEQRVASVIQAYDSQGNHRTGTDVDNASAKWLADQVYQLGAEPSLEDFTLNRIDPQSCYLRIAGRRIEGVPLFDASFTGAEGVHGRLGLPGTDAEIALVETEPYTLAAPGSQQLGQVSEARRGRHKAVVVLTRGMRPGLFLMNAPDFSKPSGPPMLQLSSAEREWLNEQAQNRTEATLVDQVRRTTARAFNVTAKIAGSNPRLAPLVFMAPRSGWWTCASEQGSRLVCWLEAIRVLATGKPVCDCLFVALSGHELDILGIDAYLKRRPDLIKRAQAWIFFGSDIGKPGQPNLIHASDDALEQWTVTAMEKEGLIVNGKARHDSVARGEAGPVQHGGGRFVTVACDSDVYHSVADRWPESVDVTNLARYARAFANGALELAQRSV